MGTSEARRGRQQLGREVRWPPAKNTDQRSRTCGLELRYKEAYESANDDDSGCMIDCSTSDSTNWLLRVGTDGAAWMDGGGGGSSGGLDGMTVDCGVAWGGTDLTRSGDTFHPVSVLNSLI